MLKSKLILWLFSLKTSLCNCHTEVRKEGFNDTRPLYSITQTGQMAGPITESSGLARVAGKETFWTHNDGGSVPALYEVDLTGRLISSRELRGVQNVDWEDLAQDAAGNLHIGDFGNNGNDRRDLRIYRINLKNPAKSETIRFQYGDQTEFPPALPDRIYDCEAFFAFGDSLYLFSKNRGRDNQVRLYVLPNQAGTHILEAKASTRIKQQVTAADVAPDGKTFALLTYGKLLLYTIGNGEINFNQPLYCLKLARKQTEGLVFVNNTDLLVTNEQGEIHLIVRERGRRRE
ncbi:MAG: hypothetical protein LH606_22200 [Cytophagaceae bacterium]|nr:hypothetical protein [Cytophagaceae bacterium]